MWKHIQGKIRVEANTNTNTSTGHALWMCFRNTNTKLIGQCETGRCQIPRTTCIWKYLQIQIHSQIQIQKQSKYNIMRPREMPDIQDMQVEAYTEQCMQKQIQIPEIQVDMF